MYMYLNYETCLNYCMVLLTLGLPNVVKYFPFTYLRHAWRNICPLFVCMIEFFCLLYINISSTMDIVCGLAMYKKNGGYETQLTHADSFKHFAQWVVFTFILKLIFENL